MERVWLYLREKHWSHRLLDTADAIVDALCRAWNALTAERLRSLTSYPYLDQVKISADRYQTSKAACPLPAETGRSDYGCRGPLWV